MSARRCFNRVIRLLGLKIAHKHICVLHQVRWVLTVRTKANPGKPDVDTHNTFQKIFNASKFFRRDKILSFLDSSNSFVVFSENCQQYSEVEYIIKLNYFLMKHLPSSLLLAFVLSISVFSVVAQKEMQLDEGLVKNSTAMPAKPKGIGTVTKYHFGDYKIASGKAGVTVTTNKSGIFSPYSESKSKKKLSFVFVRDEKDSVLVNVSIDTDVSELDASLAISFSMVNASDENYMAIFTIPSDTVTWRMIIGSRVGVGVKGGAFQGVLTDGNVIIELKEVDQYTTGKKASFGLPLGHTFNLKENSIAAVQASPDTFVKKTVWIRQDLDSKLQMILAAASAAMMVRAESAME